MRDYQTKTNIGAIPDSVTPTKHGAGEFNSMADELKTAVEKTGQTLADAAGTSEVLDQLSKALFINGTGAGACADSGSASQYELTPVTGTNGLAVPDSYDDMNGCVLSFVPGNAPTGASTINLGQTTGTLLGTKKLLYNGADTTAGLFGTANRIYIYYEPTADGGTGAWLLLPLTDSGLVVEQSGGGTLIAGRINNIIDGNTGYLFPLANSVEANTYIDIMLLDIYSDYEPKVSRTGSDYLIDKDSTLNTAVNFDEKKGTLVRLVSDGVSNWRF